MLKGLFATLLLIGGTSIIYAQDLPNVNILATGGTIAGTASSSTQVSDYKAGDLGIQTLIDAVPDLKNFANISGEQFVKISSNNLEDETLLKLGKRVNQILSKDNVSGVVITHGTDTLEETAYFLNLVVKSSKPVILVGAMRPATALSADGPMNLLQAVRVAASPEAHGKGVMVVMNDTINGARDVNKTNTTNTSTFKSPELGALGYVTGDRVRFYKLSTKRHTQRSEFDISGIEKLPRVDIIYSHVGDDGVMANASIAAGARGIIHAGTGNGSVHINTLPSLQKAVDKGVIVVRSSRVNTGATTVANQLWTKAGLLESDTLNPQKSRILLQLALCTTKDPKEIQRMFNEY